MAKQVPQDAEGIRGAPLLSLDVSMHAVKSHKVPPVTVSCFFITSERRLNPRCAGTSWPDLNKDASYDTFSLHLSLAFVPGSLREGQEAERQGSGVRSWESRETKHRR